MKLIIDIDEELYNAIKGQAKEGIANRLKICIANGIPYEERPQDEYKTACNVLLSLEQIVRKSDGWEDSAVEAVHNAVQTAIKCMHERPQGEWYYGEDECGQDGWFCSECGFFVPWYYTYYENDINFIREYKACPHCLAEMVTYTGKDRDKKGGAE